MVSVEEIRILANKREMSITDLEKKAGIANGTVGKWKYSSPTVASLEKLAAALNVPVSKLIEGD